MLVPESVTRPSDALVIVTGVYGRRVQLGLSDFSMAKDNALWLQKAAVARASAVSKSMRVKRSKK